MVTLKWCSVCFSLIRFHSCFPVERVTGEEAPKDSRFPWSTVNSGSSAGQFCSKSNVWHETNVQKH